MRLLLQNLALRWREWQDRRAMRQLERPIQEWIKAVWG